MGHRIPLLRRVGLLMALAVLMTNCTFVLENPAVRWGCGPFRYEINAEGASQVQLDAVHRAVDRYAEIIARDVEFVGLTTDRRSAGGRAADSPVLIEWFWPADGADSRMGFGEAFVVDGQYVGGSVYLRPSETAMPSWLLERLTMHELGHIGGLGDVEDERELMNPALTVDDWGEGDEVGLLLSHRPCG